MVRQEFKHLKPLEKEIAERFRNLAAIKGIYKYDIHLDVPDIKFPAWYTKKQMEYWSKLRAKRIDLTIETPNEIWVIEVTPKLSKAAIGGVLVYRDLYREQFDPGKPLRCAVVCEVQDLAYLPYAEKMNIRVFVV